AAQMVNFAVPATGSSGHIGGGILLCAMIGAFPALLSMSAVLVIQCLFFADGGLLALGCNIFNMGVVPCLLVYPLIFGPIVKKGMTIKRLTAASVAAVVVALQLGAFCVVLQTELSGITELPFATFLFLMQPVHLAIGVAEGAITAAVLCFVYKMRPEIMESSFERKAISGGVPMKKTIVALCAAALFVGVVLSMFSSGLPDGLEWATEKTIEAAGTAEPEIKSAILKKAASIQQGIALMPDYDFKESQKEPPAAGAPIAGLVGGALCFCLAGASALAISAFKKKRKTTKT
ncbi:MAG: energy-coupling factor ABC transporter permease, partial [Oscillospiraceae bacterium]|nr:energy-coupling factor ABC transporter permease [Oscillospiraceae bacterium]